MASDTRFRIVLAAGETLYCNCCFEPIQPVVPTDEEQNAAYIADPNDNPHQPVLCSPCYTGEGREAEEEGESSTGLGFNPDGTERFPTPCGHEDAPCCGCHLEMSRGDEED